MKTSGKHFCLLRNSLVKLAQTGPHSARSACLQFLQNFIISLEFFDKDFNPSQVYFDYYQSIITTNEYHGSKKDGRRDD